MSEFAAAAIEVVHPDRSADCACDLCVATAEMVGASENLRIAAAVTREHEASL